MVTKAYAFEFDPYGDNPNNKITKERHTITPVGNGQTNFFIPNKGPFHRRGFVLRNAATQLPLRPGYDYYFGFRFDQMILSGAMQPIYGAIVMNDPQANLIVEIDYQTIGGEFVLDANQITTLLANKQLDPRTVTWAAVVDIPDELPPVPHRHNVDDLVGMNEVVARLYDLIDAQEAGYNKALQALLEHIADHANPHHITLSDLGIDSLGNLVPANKEEAESGTDNVKYMTSLRVMDFTNKNIVPLINAHANRTDNPHGTTKAQVGLGSVDNYQTASVVEAQAGVATNRFMTPALTKAAIDVLAPLALASHTNNTSNPHNVTKGQVGLGSVPNYAMATLAEAISGTSTTTFMSPYLVAQAISNGSGQGLSAHLLDFSNPHHVTAAQVGLGNVPNYGVATVQEAIAGTVTDKFMTPYLVAQAMGNGAGSDVAMHLIDYNNPHNTTKAQVGLGNVENYGIAVNSDIDAMTAIDKYLVPAHLKYFLDGPVFDYIRQQAGNAVTKDSIGLDNVQNWLPATNADLVAESTSTYVTPSNVSTMMDENVRYNPAFTFRSDLLDKLTSSAPVHLLPLDNVFGIISNPDQWAVNWEGENRTATTYALGAKAIDLTVHGGNFNYTALANVAADTRAVSLFARAEDDNGNTLFYGLMYNGGKMSVVELDVDGNLTVLGISVSIPAGNQASLLTSHRFSVTQVLSSGAITATVQSEDGTYTSPTLTLTAAQIPAASAKIADTTTVVLVPVMGFAGNVPANRASGPTLTPSRVPNVTGALAGVYGTNTVYRYNALTGTWAVDSTVTSLTFQRGRTYYNKSTNELAMAVMPNVLFPLSNLVNGDLHVTGDLIVDGDIQYDDGTA